MSYAIRKLPGTQQKTSVRNSHGGHWFHENRTGSRTPSGFHSWDQTPYVVADRFAPPSLSCSCWHFTQNRA